MQGHLNRDWREEVSELGDAWGWSILRGQKSEAQCGVSLMCPRTPKRPVGLEWCEQEGGVMGCWWAASHMGPCGPLEGSGHCRL